MHAHTQSQYKTCHTYPRVKTSCKFNTTDCHLHLRKCQITVMQCHNTHNAPAPIHAKSRLAEEYYDSIICGSVYHNKEACWAVQSVIFPKATQ